jgi:diguanylate cyclase (GGDEF)-like protein
VPSDQEPADADDTTGDTLLLGNAVSARTIDLTRRYLVATLDGELDYHARHDLPLSLVLLEVDRLEEIDETRGRATGNGVLQALAPLLEQVLRPEDILCRYGPARLAAILPGTPGDDARPLAERIRTIVAAHPFEHEGRPVDVTVSVGVASMQRDQGCAAFDLIVRASGALELARQRGRSRVDDPPASGTPATA